jgi:hypothetical protein
MQRPQPIRTKGNPDAVAIDLDDPQLPALHLQRGPGQGALPSITGGAVERVRRRLGRRIG